MFAYLVVMLRFSEILGLSIGVGPRTRFLGGAAIIKICSNKDVL